MLDAKMPDGDGIGVLAAISRLALRTGVVLVSGYFDSGLVYEAIAGGAGACFSKLADASEICDAIVAVDAGGTVIPPEMQAHIADEIRRRAVTERPGVLTERETEICV